MMTRSIQPTNIDVPESNIKPKRFRKIWAVDFDGTLCTNEYPLIGKPNTDLIEALKDAQNNGIAIVLWTCREGALLENAVTWAYMNGLEFDAVNDNLQQNKTKWNNNPRKIYADVYIDDRAFDAKDKLTAVKLRCFI